MSKLKKNSKTISEKYDLVKSIIVDLTEYSFHVKKCSDDGGAHLMVYLPEDARKDFDINAFRDNKYKMLGNSRVLIAFVNEGYISNLNK
jgi:hypothetical protein